MDTYADRREAGFSFLGFWIEGRLVDAVRVRRAVWRRVLWLIGPLGVQLVLFKLMQYVLLERGLEEGRAPGVSLGAFFLEQAPVPLLLGGLAFSTAALLMLRWPVLKAAFVPLVVLIFAGVAAVLRAAVPFDLSWVSAGYFAVVREDLLFCLLAMLGVALLLHNVRGRLGRFLAGTVHLLALACMLLASLDFGYFLQTGTVGGVRELYAFVTGTPLVTEAGSDRSLLLLLVLPFVLAMLPLLADRLSVRRPRRGRGGVAVVLLPVLLLLFWPRTAVRGELVPLCRTPVVRLLDDVAGRFPEGAGPEEREVVAGGVLRAETPALRRQFEDGPPVVLPAGQ